ncbi:MAG: pilus assembly protein PilM [Proteobacteria bacterium]|nr:pilus assembly protein PilM [Pseudomonadota bacterium]
MLKVVGLDIGSYSIKAVEITSSLSSYKIDHFYEEVLPLASDSASHLTQEELVFQTMKELFESNKLEADRIVTAMPGQYISSRMLQLPFSDPRKISAALRFQVEDLVPFSLDEMIIDHQILSKNGQGSQVLVVMLQKNKMANFLSQLNRVNIDPRVVDVDSLSLFNLTPHIQVAEDELYGLVDVGHEKTSMCIMEGEKLRMFRTLNLGGKYLTEVLARDLEVSYQKSQKIKHEVSCIASKTGGEDLGLSQEELAIARTFGIASQGLPKDLARTLLAFKSLEKRPIARVYLSGGTSKLKGFAQYLQREMLLPLEFSQISFSDLHISDSIKQHGEIIPQAVAIGLRVVSGQKKMSRINLRRDEFVYSQDSEAFLKVFSKTTLWFSAIACLMIFAYIIQGIFYHHQVSKFEKSYRQKFLKIEPSKGKELARMKSFPAVRKYVENHLQLQISAKQTSVDNFVYANAGSPALQALMILSEIIPPDITVDIILYDFSIQSDSTGKIVLQGETDGYSSVVKIRDLISKHPNFNGVTEKNSGSKPGTDGKVITFAIESVFTPDALL